MKKHKLNLHQYLFMATCLLAIQISVSQTKYNFESDTAGSAPANITASNGTITTNSDPTRTQTMNPLTATSGSTCAFDMDLFSSSTDYSISWKETYTTAGRSGFTLRASGVNSSGAGIQKGYLFQVNTSSGDARIYIANTSGYTKLIDISLAAPSANSPRWYKATTEGTTLTFEYSDDGITYSPIGTTSDATYASGGTQFTRGYGGSNTGTYIDDITYKVTPDYTFESDTAGSAPANITAANGTITTNSDPTRTQTMNPLSATSGSTCAFDMDLFPSSTDYSISWKETYTTAGRSGFTLRASGVNSSGAGIQKGYLFQVNTSSGDARIYVANTSGYTKLIDISLAAPSANSPRWYKATTEGTTLTFEYSDDGITYSSIGTTSDATYASGGTQFTRGYGGPNTGTYIDDITYYQINTSTSDPITIDNISEYQVFQRNSNSQANIQISGTYTGSATSIEASFNGGAFVTIDTNPSGGNFSGTLPNQSAGQGTLTARLTNNTNITTTVNNVGIGDIFVIAGQSNASGRGNTANSYTHPTLKASLFGNDDVWKELTDYTDSGLNYVDEVSNDNNAKGSIWPLVATDILANTGVPVAFIPTAKGGRNSSYFLPPTDHSDASTLYGSINRRITAVGGVVAGILFYQGESDASSSSATQIGYENNVNLFINTIEQDFPGTKTMIGQIGYNNNKIKNDVIRAAQVAIANTNANALLGPATYDIDLTDQGGDDVHFISDSDILEFARRFYAAINKEFYGGADGYGPILDDANLVYITSTNKVVVPFTDDSNPVINPGSTVTTSSFELKNNGVSVSISGLSIVGNTIELTPTFPLNTTQPITLTYASLISAVDAAIYDSNDLPAQPFFDETVSITASLSNKNYNDGFSSFKISSNPARESINLSFINYLDKVDITIYDILGKKVLEQKEIGKKNVPIDITILKKGLYIIKVKTDKSQSTKKLVVL